jgi:hypothetical protein
MVIAKINCSSVEVSASELREIDIDIYQAFDRFVHAIREVQVTLRDTNGPKGGLDKMCTIQLRFHREGLVVVRRSGLSFAHAVHIACQKMQEVASRRLSRRRSGSFRTSQIEFEQAFAYDR